MLSCAVGYHGIFAECSLLEDQTFSVSSTRTPPFDISRSIEHAGKVEEGRRLTI
jgi:hypothetical protein